MLKGLCVKHWYSTVKTFRRLQAAITTLLTSVVGTIKTSITTGRLLFKHQTWSYLLYKCKIQRLWCAGVVDLEYLEGNFDEPE